MEQKTQNKKIEFLKKAAYAIGGIFSATVCVIVVGYSGYKLVGSSSLKLLFSLALITGGALYFVFYAITLKLQQAEDLKSEFLTVAAHNLRTPLTKIQWIITDIAERIFDQELQARFKDMQAAFKDLTKIVNRFLEMSEAGKTSIYFSYLFEEQHVEYIVLQAISQNRVGIDQKNIALTTRIQENLPNVSLDQDRIRLAVNILIENAVLYNRQNGSIDIDMYEKKGNVVCSVKDSGMGISKEDLPKLFHKFFRSQEAVSVDTDRVGLELALAKEIIEKHGGTIHAESEGKGKGATFWFTLPAVKGDPHG